VLESYRTLAAPHRFELDKVKGSRFLADVAPARSEDEAKAFLEAVRAEFHDARHHCSAWRIGLRGETFKWSDDGEPSGSAGKPILAQLEGHDLVDVVCVVTRWFGGTKLGVGGLVRAYGGAAQGALEAAQVVVHELRRTFDLVFPYDGSSAVQAILHAWGLEPTESEYQETVRLRVELPVARADAFLAEVVERTGGRVEPREIDPT
jgi:uncharacterized YigZ family protein